jgi:alpha-tubulin suppressor-like RCC1 family protein
MKHFIRALIFLSLGLPQISKAQNLQISGGNNFSAAVCDNQVVYTWGANTANQLGVDKDGNPYGGSSSTPVPVWYDVATGTGDLPAIRQVDAGSGAHVVALDCDKHVWTWGNNNCGQLGSTAAYPNQPSTCATGTASGALPKKVLKGDQVVTGGDATYLSKIIYVSGGNNTSFAIEEGTGKVLSWGENDAGQLGHGTTGTGSSLPKYVLKAPGVPLTDIVQIEGGDNCTYALDRAGNVWSWGENTGGELGRPTTPAGSDHPYAGQVQLDLNFDNASDTPVRYLTGVTQISGGDTHGLAIGPGGSVYSFGGDWGPGQRGTGRDYQYQSFAYQVLAPGTPIVADGYRTGPYLTGAIFIAAGQASSAVVLSDSTVVTFGANGLFNCTDPNSADNDVYTSQSGTLGNGRPKNGACAVFTRNDNANSPQGTIVPEYVLTAPGVKLTGIASVSDGDAWFYATNSKGQAYTWGFNRNGELGLGTTLDENYAREFNLPSGCSFADPCPPQPDLRASFTTCPIFSEKLNSQVKPVVSTWTYTWYSRPEGGGTWTPILGANKDTLTVNKVNMQYKVTIKDNRASVPFLCDACPAVSDSLIIDEILNPYTSTGCKDDVHRAAFFQITNQPTSKFEWYSKPVGGTPLPNPVDSTHSIGVYFEDTDSTSKLNGCERGLWAVDTTSYPATLRPSKPCAGTKQYNAAAYPLKIEVTKKLIVKEISFYQAEDGTNAHTYTIDILSNNATGGWNCGGCTPANTKSGEPGTVVAGGSASVGPYTYSVTNGEILRTVPMNTTLNPGIYWIRLSGGPATQFNCTKTVNNSANPPVWSAIENSVTKTGMKAIFALDNNNANGAGNVFNIKFDVGTGYNCDRIWVCADGTCVLPVQYLYFTGKKDNDIVELNWATASEKDASHFDIERSADGVNFEKIGSVSASGNSNRVIDYSFVDTNPVSGNAYYRLKQVDYNGQYEYSKIININSVKNAEEVQIVPNPNNGSFNVVVTGASKETYEISVLNALGQPIYSTSGKSESTNITQAVNIQNLASGVYYVRVITGESSTVKQIIKE